VIKGFISKISERDTLKSEGEKGSNLSDNALFFLSSIVCRKIIDLLLALQNPFIEEKFNFYL
jgi:hypothetical protein